MLGCESALLITASMIAIVLRLSVPLAGSIIDLMATTVPRQRPNDTCDRETVSPVCVQTTNE